MTYLIGVIVMLWPSDHKLLSFRYKFESSPGQWALIFYVILAQFSQPLLAEKRGHLKLHILLASIIPCHIQRPIWQVSYMVAYLTSVIPGHIQWLILQISPYMSHTATDLTHSHIWWLNWQCVISHHLQWLVRVVVASQMSHTEVDLTRSSVI